MLTLIKINTLISNKGERWREKVDAEVDQFTINALKVKFGELIKRAITEYIDDRNRTGNVIFEKIKKTTYSTMESLLNALSEINPETVIRQMDDSYPREIVLQKLVDDIKSVLGQATLQTYLRVQGDPRTMIKRLLQTAGVRDTKLVDICQNTFSQENPFFQEKLWSAHTLFIDISSVTNQKIILALQDIGSEMKISIKGSGNTTEEIDMTEVARIIKNFIDKEYRIAWLRKRDFKNLIAPIVEATEKYPQFTRKIQSMVA